MATGLYAIREISARRIIQPFARTNRLKTRWINEPTIHGGDTQKTKNPAATNSYGGVSVMSGRPAMDIS